MSTTPKVYAICDANCRWETLTREQILTAIMQAVNEGTIGDIDTGFIQTVKTINGTMLRFFYGLQSQYDALPDTEKANLFAIITNDTFREGVNSAIDNLQQDLSGLLANLEGLREELEKGYIQVGKSAIAVIAERAVATSKLDGLNYHPNHDVTEAGLYVVNLMIYDMPSSIASFVLSITDLDTATHSAHGVLNQQEIYCKYSPDAENGGHIYAVSNGNIYPESTMGDMDAVIKGIYKIATYAKN